MIKGERASSRIDLHHVAAGVPLVDSSSTRFEVLAEGAKGKTKPPSKFNYGNVTPKAAAHGGATVPYAEQ